MAFKGPLISGAPLFIKRGGNKASGVYKYFFLKKNRGPYPLLIALFKKLVGALFFKKGG
jgi:hypothetical protein